MARSGYLVHLEIKQIHCTTEVAVRGVNHCYVMSVRWQVVCLMQSFKSTGKSKNNRTAAVAQSVREFASQAEGWVFESQPR